MLLYTGTMAYSRHVFSVAGIFLDFDRIDLLKSFPSRDLTSMLVEELR
jgi:hypothetical protein